MQILDFIFSSSNFHLYLSSMLSPAIPSPPPVLGEVMGLGLVGGLGPLPTLYLASNSLMVSLTRDFGRGGGFRGLFSFRGSDPAPTFLNKTQNIEAQIRHTLF